MLTITNPKAIQAILGIDAKMSHHIMDVARLEYDFLDKSILLRDAEGLIIGNYNLLPERRKALQEYINK
jgi:hypothetical protein